LVGTFGGGVFLATCFLDLLVDVNEEFHHFLEEAKIHTHFPVAECVVCSGFFLILMLEQFVMWMRERQGHSHSSSRNNTSRISSSHSVAATNNNNNHSHNHGHHHHGSHHHSHTDNHTAHNVDTVEVRLGASTVDVVDDVDKLDVSDNNLKANPGSTHGAIFGGEREPDDIENQNLTSGCNIARPRGETTLGAVVGIQKGVENHESHNLTSMEIDNHIEETVILEPSKVRAAILLLALSVHSVFEGLAVGLESTSVKVFQLFVALGVHKSVLAFSLGMSVVQSKMDIKQVFGSVLTFAAASPVGIAIGIVVSQEQSLVTLGISTVLQGLATGTFLYVTFFEILPMEFNCKKLRMPKVASLLFGFILMAVVIGVTHDDDHH